MNILNISNRINNKSDRESYKSIKLIYALINKENIILFSILLLALILRLNNITQPYTDILSWRQTSTAMMAENYYKVNPNIFFPEVNWNGPGPSYNGREFQTISYMSALLYHVFGQQDWIGRSIAVLFGVWGVFALYKLIQRVWGIQYAVAVASIMAIMPISVFVERSFIPDPVMVSLVTTSAWLYIAYLQEQKRLLLILFIIIGCWGFLTKLPGMIIGLPLLYALVITLKQRNELYYRKFLPHVLLAFIIIIPVTLYYLWARYLSLTYPPYHFAGEDNWVWDEGVISWLRQKWFFVETFWIARNWMWGDVILLLFAGSLIASPFYLRTSRTIDKTKHPLYYPWFFHYWLLGYAVFYFIGAKEIVWNFWNFHLLSPVVAAFTGRMLVILTNHRFKSKKLIVTGMFFSFNLFVIIFNLPVIRNLYTNEYSRNGYKLGKALSKVKKNGDLVIAVSEEIGNPMPIYYSECRGWLFPPASINTITYNTLEFMPTGSESVLLLETLRKEGADWFGMVKLHYDDLKQKQPDFINHLIEQYEVKEETKEYIIFEL